MNVKLWAELVNSDRHDYLGTGRHEDQLDDPAWLADYLRRGGLAGPETAAVSVSSLVPKLKKLRAVLQAEADAVAGDPRPTTNRFKALNAFLRRAPLRRTLTIAEGRAVLKLESSPRSPASILADIAAAFAETMVRGETDRIKLCGNADCRWVFYDETKNKSRRWCGPTCGNLMKVRRFRGRRKASGRR
ncbi:MAG: CGNR zinc finger domain-containing protein [Candidatus Aminicenantes bacterium]|nr:CGNR zinc finger domain-containing protein [Candidatus Aminicenantes bacterium]